MTGEDSLENAIKKGILNDVKYHVETLGTDKSGAMNPVHLAAASGFLDIVRYLVEGAKLKAHQENGSGETPLQIASLEGFIDIVNFLRTKPDRN